MAIFVSCCLCVCVFLGDEVRGSFVVLFGGVR